MDLSGHTVLVTGGASGIGEAIATRFSRSGSEVLVCGRRADKLREVEAQHPGIKTRVCDVEEPAQREALKQWAVKEFSSLDVLVNNAGGQRYPKFTEAVDWKAIHAEIAINFEAQVHLALLLVPHLRTKAAPVIINVSSGLAFVPLTRAPIYSATKAAMHSFTLSLRHQLRDTPIQVVEVIPPAVNTDLGGPGLHSWGVPLDEFADHLFEELQKPGTMEIAYQFSAQSRRGSRQELDELFARMNDAGHP